MGDIRFSAMSFVFGRCNYEAGNWERFACSATATADWQTNQNKRPNRANSHTE